MTTEPEILIFKTNISRVLPDCKTSKTLNAEASILEWSIDTEDVDCVLRVVSPTLTPENIIRTVNLLGYECTELE